MATECPLGGTHKPNGEESALGCAMCRADAALGEKLDEDDDEGSESESDSSSDAEDEPEPAAAKAKKKPRARRPKKKKKAAAKASRASAASPNVKRRRSSRVAKNDAKKAEGFRGAGGIIGDIVNLFK